jgi:putative MATE family efflux protein
MRSKKSVMDMTEGNIWRQLTVFSLPLLLGNLMNVIYNTVDAVIVGNYVSNAALAAVGMTLPFTMISVGFFNGLVSGAGVMTARSVGAGDKVALSHALHTALLLALAAGLLLGTAGVFAAPAILRLMQTPVEIFPEASIYFRIFFTGLPLLFLYNMGNTLLNAMGNSQVSLVFMAVSSVLNVLLDLLFVLRFHLGVAGVAWATLIATGTAAALALLALSVLNLPCRLSPQSLRVDLPMLKNIVALGVPMGLQSLIVGCSNMIQQSYINELGALATAGWSVITKVDAYIYTMSTAMAMSTSAFVGQNLGAHKVERARRGVKTALILGLSVTVAISIVLLVLNARLLRIFSPDPLVIANALKFMWVMTSTYFLFSITQVIPAALAGAGHVRVPTAICVISFVVLRQIYFYFISQIHHTHFTIALGSPVTWALAGVALIIYYRRCSWAEFLGQGDGSPVLSK